MGSQFFQEKPVLKISEKISAKSFNKLWPDNIHNLSSLHQASHLVIKGAQVGKAAPDFHKSTLTKPKPLVVHLK